MRTPLPLPPREPVVMGCPIKRWEVWSEMTGQRLPPSVEAALEQYEADVAEYECSIRRSA